ncbi:hypothetical protein EGH22_04600 [Halomicroarcula sp. F28]|uniref:hypothetical protein n=1 Tax=Haloarcula salinisoli TaxID=2487746 RepID=UPI001C73B08B|nr:hypothetical protein [Halomicroarcula salinisoli]MBX0285594.1 hypothetical protein [Halomicroarcula salinisoli]
MNSQDEAPTATDPSTNATQVVEQVTIERVESNSSMVEATITYRIPANVTQLVFRIETAAVTVEDTHQFDQRGSQTYEWTGNGTIGNVTVRYPAGEGFYLDDRHLGAVDWTDEWALVLRPETRTRWAFEGSNPGLRYAFNATDGIAGEEFAYLGPHQVLTGADGQVRLVLPDSAQPITRPASIMSAVTYASRLELRDEERPSTLFVVPTTGAMWSPDGLAVGADARLSATMEASGRGNPWVHEYVHTQQRRRATTPATRWLDEGTAQYYGALVGLQRGETDPDAFRQLLASGSRYSSVVLDDPQTWQRTTANYRKGALVVAELDIRIRNATGGNATFADVMRRWSASETFGSEDFTSAVEAVAGPEVRAQAVQYTETNATPPLRSPESYEALLGESLPERPGTNQSDSEPPGVSAGATETPTRTTAQASTARQTKSQSKRATNGDGPGFGPGVALLSVLLVAVGFRFIPTK